MGWSHSHLQWGIPRDFLKSNIFWPFSKISLCGSRKGVDKTEFILFWGWWEIRDQNNGRCDLCIFNFLSLNLLGLWKWEIIASSSSPLVRFSGICKPLNILERLSGIWGTLVQQHLPCACYGWASAGPLMLLLEGQCQLKSHFINEPFYRLMLEVVTQMLSLIIPRVWVCLASLPEASWCQGCQALLRLSRQGHSW